MMKNFLTVGEITEVKSFTTKKGDKMAVIQLEDLSGDYEVVVFPEVFTQSEDTIQVGKVVAVKGFEEEAPDGTMQITASAVALYSDLADLFIVEHDVN